MKKLALLAALALCGCGADVELIDSWEFQTSVPIGTTPQQLTAIEANLHSNGFKRVRMFNRTNGWTDTPVAIVIYATRKEKK